MPTRRVELGTRVPDLTRIAQDRWREVLGALPRAQRMQAAQHPGLGGRLAEAVDLAESLPQSASEGARAALDGAPSIPVPRGRRVSSARQVNVKLARHEYEDLAVASHLLGAKPTQIARMLVLNGVRRVLAEHDAAIAAARRGAT